jgi:hypothetical protein
MRHNNELATDRFSNIRHKNFTFDPEAQSKKISHMKVVTEVEDSIYLNYENKEVIERHTNKNIYTEVDKNDLPERTKLLMAIVDKAPKLHIEVLLYSR